MRRVYGVKVTRLTLGGLSVCLGLGASRDAPMDGQKSAEAVVVARARRRRAEHEEPNRTDAFEA